MSVYAGDFLGFQIGDVHSQLLNITRVSSGDRYSDNLIPTFNDNVATVPGGDGTYYWDSNKTSRTFNIDFAFDDLRDEDIRHLRQIFGSTDLQQLIFDEFPYKKYMVKASSQPTLKYICFQDGEIRLYKGEGSASFVAYFPFATSLEENKISNSSSNTLMNDGDMPTSLILKYLSSDIASGLQITLKQIQSGEETTIASLKLDSFSAESGDQYIQIDTKTFLIEGLDSDGNKTGNLYNKYISEGDFFTLPVGLSDITSSQEYQELRYNLLYY